MNSDEIIKDDSGMTTMYLANPNTKNPDALKFANLLFIADDLQDHLVVGEILLPTKFEKLMPYIKTIRIKIEEMSEIIEEAKNLELGDEKIDSLTDDVLDQTEKVIEQMREMEDRQEEGDIHTLIWPMFFDHMIREGEFILSHQNDIKEGRLIDINELVNFWTEIMAEHGLFTSHLLDPTESDLIEEQLDVADTFYDFLESETTDYNKIIEALDDVINSETELIENLENGNVASIIPPELADHMREETLYFKNELLRLTAKTE
ncbi:TPA: DUF2935 domain-containing protein [Candidatus Berkelbacteria bacterium]|uniref:Uncharacterized protein n=1 Tax=Berkelbacteria bacterium GW2011_GWE1_39_12 TaxID=1618337 RepID=A0A0G4B5E3_9BACT|nr:MAG: hypothetical protein UT28_C0001G0866 [Berkelbacteria bacterium GW2011_GWE1_39_12]HBO60270.1 DUF2935 domain-containing protein [Candidatus Berkelbacteria bacterium]